MVKYFCYFEEEGEFSPSTQIFRIKVGKGHRDQVHKTLVENYAADCGFYFRPWDKITDDTLILKSANLVSDCGRMGIRSNVITITISDFYRHLIDGDLNNVRQSSNVLRNIFRMSSILSPNFYAKNHRSSQYHFAPTFSRQYLSHGEKESKSSAVIGMLMVVILFLIQAFLDGIENGLY